MSAYVYILSNCFGGVLYTGVTTNLIKRIYEHKDEIYTGFSKIYNLKKLVYYEIFEDIENAIKREKQIKKYLRRKKLELISAFNPEWKDLYSDICK